MTGLVAVPEVLPEGIMLTIFSTPKLSVGLQSSSVTQLEVGAGLDLNLKSSSLEMN